MIQTDSLATTHSLASTTPTDGGGFSATTPTDGGFKSPLNPNNIMIKEMNTGAGSKWNAVEDAQLRKAVSEVGAKNWKRISQEYLQGERSDVQCLHRWQKVLKPGLRKGFWSEEEDATIRQCIMEGITKWSNIAAKIPGRIGKQIRERWYNHL
jgi:hypothetical protein